MRIQIHRLLGGQDVVVGELKMGSDGKIDFGGLRPTDDWLRDFICVELPSKRKLTAAAGERWLKAFPYNLRGSFTWATEQDNEPARSGEGVNA